jgi:predicted transposase YbfD/YdcC
MKYNTSRVEYNVGLREFMLGEFVFDVHGLYAHLEELRDGRALRGVRYRLADALTLIILAKLGGEDGPRGIADWLKQRAKPLVSALKLPREAMPHATTISRILGRAVQAEELEQVVGCYWRNVAQASHAVVVSIDGKVLRGTIQVGHSQGVHLLAAYVPEDGLVLMQVEIASKENEICAAPSVLSVLDLRKKVVIGDAMHTQRRLSIEIVAHGGDYIWTAKGNQAEVQDTIAHLFEPEPVTPGFAPTPTDFETAHSLTKAHSRLERRTLTTSSMLKDYLDWPYLEQVFKLERHFIDLKTGQVAHQIIYGLTSLSRKRASPKQLLNYVRTYWGIENGLHYRRDVTFKEDRCRLRIGHAARTMATLNNLALSLILHQGYTNVPDARRRYAAHPLEALQLIFQHP